ncbi:MAG: hypothetical protein V1926_04810 [Candidatus Peregrinibacteria bacterium]
MIFSRSNAGKWVASKAGKVVESSKELKTLLRKVEGRADRQNIRFDKVPPDAFVGGSYGI